MVTQTKETQANITPQDAVKMLAEGNKRFINNQKADRNLMEQVKQTSTGQHPFAIVLSCIDSRTSSELIFDLGMGDIFNARIAGNIVNEDILGSMEFACKVAGSKLIVVLGHTKCGAVKGACDHVELGNLTGLVNKIEPAVSAVQTEGPRNSSNAEFVEKVAEENVYQAINEIQKKSPILKEMLDSGEIGIIGGMYDVSTGQVEFYEHTFNLRGAANEEFAGKH